MAEPLRAALVPICGDPVVATFWWKFFANWYNEIDKLYIYVGSDAVPMHILEYLWKLFNHPKVEFAVVQKKDHGIALKKLVEDCKEPYVFLVEEDAYIFKPGIVELNFNKIISKEYDFIGSPRDSACKEIKEVELERYGKELEQLLFDNGPNFWPNFVFTTKDLLMKTDRHFWAKIWKKGDYIKELDHTMKEDGGIDTFSWVSIQIRELTKKIGFIPQYKAYPIDPYLYRNREWTFRGEASWIHAGSLSSGVVMYLQDKNNKPLFGPEPMKLNPKDIDHEDFVMRCAWWHMALTFSFPMLVENGLSEFANMYGEAIHKLMFEFGISQKELLERIRIYTDLFGDKYVPEGTN